VPALVDTLGAGFRFSQLIAPALTKPAISLGEESNVVQRTDAFHRLKSKHVRVTTDGFREEGLEIPRVRNDDMIGFELVNRPPKAILNCRDVPSRRVKFQRLTWERRRHFDLSGTPMRVLRIKVPHIETSSRQKGSQFDGVYDPAACRRPVEKQA
jgi:hypothetical protein